MIDIHLNLQGSQLELAFLSIPQDDIQRLSIHPFCWLRYVMFSICGAYGELSTIPGGPPVDYHSTELAEIPYYYTPSGDCSFVDYEGLNDQVTTTAQGRCTNFRREVQDRDGGFCIITREAAVHCDAAHLIPHSKGDEYIHDVVHNRSPLYHHSSPPLISGIDDVQNGVLLAKNLHSRLARGEIAFLKTPNYGLEPTDIKRLGRNQGPVHTDHITLQQLKKLDSDNQTLLATITNTENLPPAAAFSLGAHVDALFQGTGSPLPPVIILDYLYGIAAYRCWRSGQVHSTIMESHRKPPINHDINTSAEEENTTQYSGSEYFPSASPEEQDDTHPHGPTYGHGYTPLLIPQRPSSDMSMREGDTMGAAMDELNAVLMSLSGITPQEASNRRAKRMEEEELKAQAASRSKVTEWMKTSGL